MHTSLSRRRFLGSTAVALTASSSLKDAVAGDKEPIIDIHQHTHYHGRTDDKMLSHQRAMGVTTTILLPAGRPVKRPSTHNGRSNGLAAKTGGNDTVMAIAKKYPNEFIFGVNEVPDLPDMQKELEKYLKAGAVIIAEQKFKVPCDSKYVWAIAEVAQEFNVPVLMHFQHNSYNLNFERFHRTLEKFPKVNFIGHAQTWWGNIDKKHDQKVMYPQGKVTAGGLTDQYLKNYGNMYGDLSAGSGLNSLIRDEEHTKGFFERHQNKLLYGSDCADSIGRGNGCQGSRTIAAVRRIASSKKIERKLLFENARKLFKL
ncbi:MAG TPA: amidohydrolase [Verrucomicrobiales bacterium]|nr:amidohydrolase [Verrucomicrobiales bacterium]